MANEKLPVTLVQDKAGTIKAVKVNGVEIPVLRAGPSPAIGQMDLIITLANVDLSFEVAEPAPKDA